MARRRSSSKREVSLFPFLDILGCLIGSLILIITTVVLEQMDQPSIVEAAKIDDMKQEAASEAARREQLERRLADLDRKAGPVQQRLDQARKRADEAARKAAEAQQQLAAAEKLTVDAPKPPPPADTASLTAQRRKLDAEIATIKADIVARQRPPEQSIVVLPPGSGGGPKRGYFVEAANGKAVFHDGKSPWETAASKIAGDPRYKELLKKAATDKDAIITILIRPDGVGTYWELQKAATAAGARTGRVPLPGAGKLDLTGAK